MPTANIILSGKRQNAFPLKSGKIQRMSALTTLISHNTKSPS